MTRTSMIWKTLLTLAAAAVAAGCANSSTFRSAPEAGSVEGASSDVITAVELGRLDQGLSLMDVVEHARPWFLHPRGSTSTVSIDNAPPIDLSALRAIPVARVKEVRLLRAAGQMGPTAIRSDGTTAVGPVILVVTGGRRP